MIDTLPLNFFVAGFSKCGTTTLSHLLRTHPEIALPSIKEPSFFSSPDFEHRWNWFRALYPAHLSQFRAIGDDSNQYSSFDSIDEVAPLLADRYPNARLIFLARDPVERIESAFRHIHDDGSKYGISCSFHLHEAMRQVPGILQNAKFWNSIAPYLARFPEHQILVIHLEDLVDDLPSTMDRVFSHLGLDPSEASHPGFPPQLNSTSERFHDTKLLRRLRSNGVVGPRLARLRYEEQERLLRPLRLRRPFARGHRPSWSAQALEIFRDEIVPDALEFARAFGLPQRGWSRVAELTGHDFGDNAVTAWSTTSLTT